MSAPSKSLTIGDVIALYQRHAKANGVHGDAAGAEREYTFGLFVAEYGRIPAREAKPFHLTDFIDRHPEWKSVATKRQKAGGIKAAFRWAWLQERIDRHPFANVQYGEHERRPELPDEVLQLLVAAATKPFERVLRFLRFTACRLGELCEARWKDVDLDRGVWFVEKHKSRRYTNKPKVVALIPEAVDLLRADLVRQMQRRGLLGWKLTDGETVIVPDDLADAPIFLNSHGKAWTPGVLGNTYRRMKKTLGIKTKASLHGVRHRALSAMVENGAPLKLVAEQAGHASTAVTERFYLHIGLQQIDAIRDAAARGRPKLVI